MKPILSLAALLVSASTFAASIFPNPQKMTAGSGAFESATATYRLTGAGDADADAIAALQAKLSPSANAAI